MINNLESYNKAQLIELAKTHIEEYQKLERNLGLIKLGNEQQHKQLISCETALDERNDKVSLQASRIAELEKERDEYHAMVVYTAGIMEQSTGVAGWHLNGDIAEWDELFTDTLYKDALEPYNLEQQAKGVTQFTNKACGDCITEYQTRLSCDANLYCKSLVEQTKQLREGVK